MSERNEDWISGFNRGRQIAVTVGCDHSAETLKQSVLKIYEGIGIEGLSKSEAFRLTGSISALITEIVRLNLEIGNDETGGIDDKPKLH